MPINKKRLADFRREIADLQNQLSFEEFYQTIKAKILNALSFEGGKQFQQLSAGQQRRFVERLFRPEHQKFVSKIFDSYNSTLDVVNELYKDLGVDINRDFQKIRAIEKVNREYLGAYEEASVKDIQKVLRIGLTAGEDIKRISSRLKTLDEKVVHYADTIARTQVKGYARTAKSEKARVAEIFLYEYTGFVIATTRPFCLVMLGKTLHIDTIRKLRNGNKEPVLNYCGGWNCHHDWEPDAFAKKEDAGEFQEQLIGRRTVKVYSDASLSAAISTYENKQASARKKARK